jgi:hypothetical protein
MMRRPSRPVGITILALLEILIGTVGFLASLLIIGFSALFSTLPRVGALLGTVGLFVGGIVLFFSLIWLATGVGFLHGRGWSWTLGMVFSALSLIGAIGALTIGLVTGAVGGLIFWGLMLYYLTRTHVKVFFGKTGVAANLAYGLPYTLGPQVAQSQIAGNASYGRPSTVNPPVAVPSISQGPPTFVPGPSSPTPPSSSLSNSGKVPICPYCHNTLPMGTKKCLTCGAAL